MDSLWPMARCLPSGDTTSTRTSLSGRRPGRGLLSRFLPAQAKNCTGPSRPSATTSVSLPAKATRAGPLRLGRVNSVSPVITSSTLTSRSATARYLPSGGEGEGVGGPRVLALQGAGFHVPQADVTVVGRDEEPAVWREHKGPGMG